MVALLPTAIPKRASPTPDAAPRHFATISHAIDICLHRPRLPEARCLRLMILPPALRFADISGLTIHRGFRRAQIAVASIYIVLLSFTREATRLPRLWPSDFSAIVGDWRRCREGAAAEMGRCHFTLREFLTICPGVIILRPGPRRYSMGLPFTNFSDAASMLIEAEILAIAHVCRRRCEFSHLARLGLSAGLHRDISSF